MNCFLFWGWFLISAVLVSPSIRSQIMMEEEPNNEAIFANNLTGESIVLGELETGDRDVFDWTVSDVDASSMFRIWVLPPFDTVFFIEMLPLDSKDSASPSKPILSLSTPDGMRPLVSSDLILDPGRYEIRVSSQEGRGGYCLKLEKSRPVVTEKSVIGQDGQDIQPVRIGAKETAYYVEAEHFGFNWSDPEDVQKKWHLRAQVNAGRNMSLTVSDVEGRTLQILNANGEGLIETCELTTGPDGIELDFVIMGNTGSFFCLKIDEDGLPAVESEIEPNDDALQANLVKNRTGLNGTLSSDKDTDWFRFLIQPGAETEVFDVRLVSENAKSMQICLYDSHRRVLQCREGNAPLELSDLSLNPGEYLISVGRSRQGVQYAIEFTGKDHRMPGFEIEPDDTVLDGLNAGNGGVFESRFSGRDTDYYWFLSQGDPGLWRIELSGNGIGELVLYDSAGKPVKEVQVAYGTPRTAIANVLLFPGLHHVSVRGHDTAYQLKIIPLGPPGEGSEIEPNDESSRSIPIRFNQKRTGIIAEPSDKDLYRFFLAREDRIKLTIHSPGTEGLRAILFWDGRKLKQRISESPEDPTILEGLYPPGDYELELWAREPMAGEYSILLERLERFDMNPDREPNDIPAQARAIPANLTVTGAVGDFDGDVDYYELPVFAEDREIFVSNPDGVWLFLEPAAGGKAVRLERSDKSDLHEGRIIASQRTLLKIDGRSRYTCTITFSPEWKPELREESSPIQMKIELTDNDIAAYYEHAQRILGSIEILNPDTESHEVDLETYVSDFGWTMEVIPDTLRIDAGQRSVVSFHALAPANIWSNHPIKLTVRAISADGRSVSVSADIVGIVDHYPVNPCHAWPVPDSLRGGFNLAASNFGAKLILKGGSDPEKLFDRMTPLNDGFTLRNKDISYMPAVELAGNGLIPVAGFALNPQGKTTASEMLRDFEIDVSMDGVRFDTALTGVLEPIPREQFFALSKPLSAKYARLRLMSSQVGLASDAIGLGEWKVIGVPGADPFPIDRFNIADPVFGGHVVWADPQIDPAWDQVILTPEVEATAVRLPAGRIAQWVIGFEHERAARIDSLEWMEAPAIASADRFKKVIVSVSTFSSTGPWTALGTWDLSSLKSNVSIFNPESPVWARYVMISDASATPKEISRQFPAVIRIFEHKTGDGYLSVLGEWGHYGSASMYETNQEINAPQEVLPSTFGNRNSAQLLSLGETISGQVLLGRREEWYQVLVPSPNNTLNLSVKGDSEVRVQVDMQTQDGLPIEPAEPEQSWGELRYSIPVKPGESYFIRISEPPRSVVFAWDTSNSVAAYLPVIYSVLSRFAEEISRNVEFVNLLPFGGNMLLDRWSDQAVLLRTVLNLYERDDFSSSAEYTLRLAAEALANRKGTKVIVLVTDGATPRDPSLWKILRQVRPKIFSLAISSGGNMHPNPPLEQDLMQTWSHVNGGFYEYLRTQGELERGFERVSAMLRKPALYSLIATASRQSEPNPGKLRLTCDPMDRPAGAVELILDASGSMLQKMGSESRIEIAKKVLSEVIENQLPAGMPVALRVFGNREANACTTDLVMPLQPLDAQKMKQTLRGLTAKNLSKTPIADSLKLIHSDLANVKGRKLVILVTDGEETCGGNPVEAIQALQSQGVDICLNIVGFGVSNANTSAQFREWADAGNGRHFEADETESLKNSIIQALQIPFSVIDDSGSTIAEGTVNGRTLILPAGRYRIEVFSDPPETIESVDIASDRETELKIK